MIVLARVLSVLAVAAGLGLVWATGRVGRRPGTAPSEGRWRPTAVAWFLVAVAPGVVLGPPWWFAAGAAVLIVRSRRAARAQRLAEQQLEEAARVAQLVAIAIAAGCSPAGAVTRVARLWVHPGAPGTRRAIGDGDGDGVGEGLLRVERSLASGAPFVDATAAWAIASPDVAALVSTLVDADRTGAAVASSLESAAAALHRQHGRALLRRARRLPVTTLGPLVVCVLPAFVLLSVVPMVAAALARLDVVP